MYFKLCFFAILVIFLWSDGKPNKSTEIIALILCFLFKAKLIFFCKDSVHKLNVSKLISTKKGIKLFDEITSADATYEKFGTKITEFLGKFSDFIAKLRASVPLAQVITCLTWNFFESIFTFSRKTSCRIVFYCILFKTQPLN